MSRNAWVNVGAGAFVLTCKKIAFRIEKSEDGLYRCFKRVTMDNRGLEQQQKQQRRQSHKKGKLSEGSGTAMFMTKANELPIQSDTLEDCFHGVDTWITKNLGNFPEVSRFAKWRKRPASESQLNFLRKLGYDHDPLDDIGGGSEDDAGDDDGESGGSILAKELEMTQRKRKEVAAKSLTMGQAANMITRLVHGAGKRWTESKKFEVKKSKALAKEIDVEVGPIPKFVDI